MCFRLILIAKMSEQHHFQLHVTSCKADKFSQLCKGAEKCIFMYVLIVQFYISEGKRKGSAPKGSKHSLDLICYVFVSCIIIS